MAKRKLFDWFLTDNGKNFSLLSTAGVMNAVMLGHIVPNTILSSKYRDVVRLYSKGFSVPVPEKIQQRFTRTLDLLEIESSDRHFFRSFMAAGFDIFSLGMICRFGVHIGIPVNFTYDDVDSIDKSRILVNLEPVVWDSDSGKQLLNSLVLPESAQLYAMAREIKIGSSYKLVFESGFAGAVCLSAYALGRYMNTKLNLYSKPRSVRVIGYTLASLFCLGNYIMFKDSTQNYYETRFDKELKEKSPVFAEGGKQFYTKILERNKALRVLMGSEGERTYTVLGNENYYLRHKHLPLVQRKQFFETEDKPLENNLEEGTKPLIA